MALETALALGIALLALGIAGRALSAARAAEHRAKAAWTVATNLMRERQFWEIGRG